MKVYYNNDDLTEIQNGVITIGSFDGVHVGHRAIISSLIENAKRLKSHSIIITFEPHPRHILQSKNKSFHLLTLLPEKLELLRSCGIDNVVVIPFSKIFSKTSPIDYIRDFLIGKFHPKAIVIGYDHRFGKDREGNIDMIRKHLGSNPPEIIEIEKKQIDMVSVSSTATRRALSEGDVSRANSLLGYPYRLTGTVRQGNKIGRQLGYPTANIEIESEHKLIPKNGIYAVTGHVEKKNFQGMLYIGVRPSINSHLKKVIEVNIFDYNNDIYGKEISVNLLAFIREDKKADSHSDLKELIKNDELTVKAFLKNTSDE